MKPFEQKLQHVTEDALKILKKEKAYVDIYLIGTESMRLLNKKFRKKDKPATVLSFEKPAGFPEEIKGQKYLGEIYLCPAYIRNQKEEIESMLIHGLLHLLGYNHSSRSDRIRMEKLEKKLWRTISSSV